MNALAIDTIGVTPRLGSVRNAHPTQGMMLLGDSAAVAGWAGRDDRAYPRAVVDHLFGNGDGRIDPGRGIVQLVDVRGGSRVDVVRVDDSTFVLAVLRAGGSYASGFLHAVTRRSPRLEWLGELAVPTGTLVLHSAASEAAPISAMQRRAVAAEGAASLAAGLAVAVSTKGVAVERDHAVMRAGWGAVLRRYWVAWSG